MTGPADFRDSTQIVLPRETLEAIHGDIESRYAVTVHDEGCAARIIGSPTVIKEVTEFLVRHGISLR